MSAAEVILVTGALGNVGREVVAGSTGAGSWRGPRGRGRGGVHGGGGVVGEKGRTMVLLRPHIFF
jgi:hypothetical protein